MNKLGWLLLVGFGSAALVSACGGASEGGGVFSDAGGDGSGASSGSGGSSSHAGSSSAAGASDGVDEGGAGNGSPGNMPGSAGDGTSLSMGGAGGLVTPPDPAVREGCADWCDSVVATACSDQTRADCLLGCRAIATSPACNASYKTLFDCAKGATFSCDNDGNAVPQGCEGEYAQAALCVLSSPDTTLAKPCKSYCDNQAAAACPNSNSASECTYGCELTSSLVPACADDWKTFVDCAQDSEVTCNDTGDPVPTSCIAEYLRYVACVVEAGQ